MTISSAQQRALSQIALDLGKIVVAASVIGFFIPGFSGEVGATTMVVGSTASILLFAVGIYGAT